MSLNSDYIWTHITGETKLRLSGLEVLASVDSTNEYLLRICRQSPDVSTMACLAEQQTAGRGCRGRHWYSPPKANLYLSILWRYDAAPANRAILPLRVAVVIAETLRRIGVEGIALKW